MCVCVCVCVFHTHSLAVDLATEAIVGNSHDLVHSDRKHAKRCVLGSESLRVAKLTSSNFEPSRLVWFENI